MGSAYTRFMLEAIFAPPIIIFGSRAIIGLLVCGHCTATTIIRRPLHWTMQ